MQNDWSKFSLKNLPTGICRCTTKPFPIITDVELSMKPIYVDLELKISLSSLFVSEIGPADFTRTLLKEGLVESL